MCAPASRRRLSLLAREFVYAVVLRLPSGKHSDGGTVRYRRELKEHARVEYAGTWWLVDHVVADGDPPLVYLVPEQT